MSSQELSSNFKVIASPHHQTRTIIKISKHEKRVEESNDKKISQHHQQQSTLSNEATNDQHRMHTESMFQRNIALRNEDFQEAASEVKVLSSESDENLHRHVLNIDLSHPLSNSANHSKCLSRKNITTMSINQDHCDRKLKPFDGNLSDDQKLVLSVSDGASQCAIKNKNEMKLLNANVKGISLSGKCSPYEDHLDSGTCSDAEVISFQSSSESPQPPPVPPKGNRSMRQKQHVLSDSFSSDASSASSSDSVQISRLGSHLVSPDLIRSINDQHKTALLPTSLLLDIRNHPASFNDGEDQDKELQDEDESNYLDLCNSDTVNEKMMMNYYSGDSFYKFHMNEHLSYDLEDCKVMIHDESDESFAGIKDLRSGTSTIRSAKGTIRGVKNRVRNGIATFLQMQQTTVKVSLHTTSSHMTI